ncbi:MAG TPA: hypothetical protein VGU61_19965 [Noviherbaspirillum sp.]|jgi:hypothetical protein|uniref:hypothetical protein n=1 Tax=Noviherbaspirillum sp. TaxID=1926288 RepID=UPI002DDD1BAC|nr:hypothetical protein [Noviherbaspirillum sp.]HEV2612549.1 hypothetical protein [Noviherbaspirillum sp.]
MTNEEIHAEIGAVKGLIQAMADRFNRMEKSIDSVVSLDKAVGEQAIRHDNQQREIRELAHDIKNCQQHHILQNTATATRVSTLEEKANKVQGAIFAMKVFSGFVSMVLVFSSKWAYDRIETDHAKIIALGHRSELRNLEVADLQRQINEMKQTRSAP